MAKTVIDPLTNEIFVAKTILDFNERLTQSEDVFDDVTKVIEKPIMLFKMKKGPMQLYYLRAIGWNKTMLIGVQNIGGRYEAINYQIDPPIELVGELHRDGERLI